MLENATAQEIVASPDAAERMAYNDLLVSYFRLYAELEKALAVINTMQGLIRTGVGNVLKAETIGQQYLKEVNEKDTPN